MMQSQRLFYLSETGPCVKRRETDRASLFLRPGEHVDILGRSSLNDLILRIAGGKGDLIEDTVSSDILEYSRKVQIFDDPQDPAHEDDSAEKYQDHDEGEGSSDDFWDTFVDHIWGMA